MNRSELAEQWREQIEDFTTSGMTAQEWSNYNRVPLNQLQYWKRRLKELDKPQSNATTWTALEIAQPSPSSITLRIGGASIDLNSGFDQSLLREVVCALEATS